MQVNLQSWRLCPYKSMSTDTTNSAPTPTEQLESAYQIIVKDLAADLLQKVLEQSPKCFEQIVVDLMFAMGYGDPSDDARLVARLLIRLLISWTNAL